MTQVIFIKVVKNLFTWLRSLIYPENGIFLQLAKWDFSTKIGSIPRGEGGGGQLGFQWTRVLKNTPKRVHCHGKIHPKRVHCHGEIHPKHVYHFLKKKNTPFYAFLGMFSTKPPLLKRFACINACTNADKKKIKIYIHFRHLRSNKRPVIKK